MDIYFHRTLFFSCGNANISTDIIDIFISNNIIVLTIYRKNCIGSVRIMVTINDAQQKLMELINSRNSMKRIQTVTIPKIPSRIIGERMLDAFANQIMQDCEGLESDPSIEDELIESLLSTLALAGIVGVDLEKKLNEVLGLMEIVTADSA